MKKLTSIFALFTLLILTSFQEPNETGGRGVLMGSGNITSDTGGRGVLMGSGNITSDTGGRGVLMGSGN